jgi:hypothetical protein
MKFMKHLAVAGGLLVAATAVTAVAAPSASADPFTCYGNAICAKVTAIDSGSYLLLHNKPNYADGARPGSPHLTNGHWLVLYCYTTGPGDADGHGDTYWWGTADQSSGVVGYVNDYYVTTGTPATFKKTFGKCP